MAQRAGGEVDAGEGMLGMSRRAASRRRSTSRVRPREPAARRAARRTARAPRVPSRARSGARSGSPGVASASGPAKARRRCRRSTGRADVADVCALRLLDHGPPNALSQRVGHTHLSLNPSAPSLASGDCIGSDDGRSAFDPPACFPDRVRVWTPTGSEAHVAVTLGSDR